MSEINLPNPDRTITSYRLTVEPVPFVRHEASEFPRIAYAAAHVVADHVDFAGGIVNEISNTLEYLKKNNKSLPVEIEVRNLAELKQVLDFGGVNRIMLDNFPLDRLKEAIKMVGGQYETEASGGITETTLRSIAETGVNFISVGALTHHIKSLDLSLKAF